MHLRSRPLAGDVGGIGDLVLSPAAAAVGTALSWGCESLAMRSKSAPTGCDAVSRRDGGRGTRAIMVGDFTADDAGPEIGEAGGPTPRRNGEVGLASGEVGFGAVVREKVVPFDVAAAAVPAAAESTPADASCCVA